MTRQRVSSTSIRSIGYDADHRILEVEFRNDGIYQYFDVPREEYDDLVGAASIGRYYSKIIKPTYTRFRKVR
ncbi:MAG: KTSC domain-containing protein [Pyrinomonadaceae bacterium]